MGIQHILDQIPTPEDIRELNTPTRQLLVVVNGALVSKSEMAEFVIWNTENNTGLIPAFMEKDRLAWFIVVPEKQKPAERP